MKRQARLGAARFEELQMMKFAWRNDMEDFATSNSSQIEEIEGEITQYKDILLDDQAHNDWDKSVDEFYID